MNLLRSEDFFFFPGLLVSWLVLWSFSGPLSLAAILLISLIFSMIGVTAFSRLRILFGGLTGLLVGGLSRFIHLYPELILLIGALVILVSANSRKGEMIFLGAGLVSGFFLLGMLIEVDSPHIDYYESISELWRQFTFSISLLLTIAGVLLNAREPSGTEHRGLDSEAFYQMLLAHVPMDIVVFDHEHKYLLLTEKSIKDPVLRAWMIGKDDYDYVAYRNKPIEIADERRACFLQAKEEGKTTQWEDHYTLADGSEQYILRMLHPVYTERGELQYMVGIGWDITERKLAEIKMQEAADIARKASEAKASFLSMMSHEIRTPMNAVIAMTEWMQAESPREDQQEPLEIIRFSGENLMVLINDILDFSKIEAGKIDLENRPVDICQLLENIRNSHLESAREKGVSLSLKCSPSLNYSITTDSTRLSQILNNLISNAVKFTEEGQVSVHVTAGEISEGKIPVYIRVEDSGIGIPTDKLKTIFEPFSQAENSTTRRFGGTGLGLAITSKLTALLGGEIRVDSAEGRGSTFFLAFKFPIDKPISLTKKTGKREQEKDMLTGMNVLAVEDHPVNGKVLMKFLNKWETNATWVESGPDALTFLSNGGEVDLILMDLQMPEMDGFETTRRIRNLGNRFSTVPIYALSANALNDVESEVVEAGMQGFIPKPFRPKQLKEILSQHQAVAS